MKTFLSYAALAILATQSTAQDFHPDNGGSSGGESAGESCRRDSDCWKHLVCIDGVCSDGSGGGGAGMNPGEGSSGEIPAGDMCQPGQICEGGEQCPSCFTDPCTCPEVQVAEEAAVF